MNRYALFAAMVAHRRPEIVRWARDWDKADRAALIKILASIERDLAHGLDADEIEGNAADQYESLVRPALRRQYVSTTQRFIPYGLAHAQALLAQEDENLPDDKELKETMSAWIYRQINLVATKTSRARLRFISPIIAEATEQGKNIRAIMKRIRKRSFLKRYELMRIARTEVLAASNAGFNISAEEVLRKGSRRKWDRVWIAGSDDRTRDTHAAANGQRCPVDGMFTVGGHNLKWPGDRSSGAPAHETIHCRCTTAHIPSNIR